MKKILFAILLTAGIVATSQAQIIHIGGIQAIDAGYGKSKFGNYFTGGYIRYFSPQLYGKATLYFEKGTDAGVKYSSAGLDITAAYTVLKVGETIFINAIGGMVLSNDVLAANELLTVPATLKVGAFAGIESELFLSDKFALILNWNQRYVLGQAFGNVRWYGHAAIRYSF